MIRKLSIRQFSSNANDLLASIAAQTNTAPKRRGRANVSVDQLLAASAPTTPSTTTTPTTVQPVLANNRKRATDNASVFKPNFVLDSPINPVKQQILASTPAEHHAPSSIDSSPLDNKLKSSTKPFIANVVIDTLDDDEPVSDSVSRNKRKHGSKNGKEDIDRSHAKKSGKKPFEKDHTGLKEKKEKKKVVEQPRDILLPDGISVVNMGSLLGVSFGKLASKMKELGFEYPTPDFVLNTDISSLI
ncbi:UNVERIFIED_CONTAM: hypothetical protein HDU68_004760, partial [Siphonaria sp. JEL0065]